MIGMKIGLAIMMIGGCVGMVARANTNEQLAATYLIVEVVAIAGIAIVEAIERRQ